MMNELSERILVLGVDGMDPALTRKFVADGVMPATQKFIARGAQREDLILLGAMPTVTPPMWTTLATGAYPITHNITCFWAPDPQDLSKTAYNLDSRTCTAEPLWNVFAECGKKTLVWHWPGSSWPPTSESPNLHVVDGTQPVTVNFGVANVDWEKFIYGAESYDDLRFFSHDNANTGAGCIINDLGDVVADENAGTQGGGANLVKSMTGGGGGSHLILDENDTEIETLGRVNLDKIQSPIRPASNWSNAPLGAKEMVILTSDGKVRRPVLLLKNEAGVYDHAEIYTSKKSIEPLCTLYVGELAPNVLDEIKGDEIAYQATRHMKLMELAADGSSATIWLGCAMDIANDSLWHPKTLYQQVIKNVGYTPICSLSSARQAQFVPQLMLPCWEIYAQWQADALLNLIEENQYQMIFSHLHSIDIFGHQLWHLGKHQDCWDNDEAFYQNAMCAVYEQADRYFARFLPLLDEGWTIIITSDHGLLTTEELSPILGEASGVNVGVMEELGFTVLKRDENGQKLKEIDWSKTRAVASRANHIYINLKGKYKTGIVEPSEQYRLEEEIINALYQYRDPRTGRRVVSIALRNKDALVLGTGGERCGDILYYLEENFTQVHANALSTHLGYGNTSVSPIFIAAGTGLKTGFTTRRIIRQADVAPTIAVLGGVRMPVDCEGAPIYQILAQN